MGISEDITLFEQQLNELVIKYEQYFIGLEKREPLQLLDSVERAARKHQNVRIVNTMLKFRYNALVARFNSYRQHWQRIIRLIEDGKYSRDRFKMEMHQQPPPGDSKDNSKDNSNGKSGEADAIYQQYLKACQQCNIESAKVSRELIETTIAKQKPALAEKYKCDKIEFRVVVEDGKPKIKARPLK